MSLSLYTRGPLVYEDGVSSKLKASPNEKSLIAPSGLSMTQLSSQLLLLAGIFGVLAVALSVNVQVGHRFPLGVQVGNAENVTCEAEEDVGLLRFQENQVQVCQLLDDVAGEYGFVVVGSNETVVQNQILNDLKQQLDDLKATGIPADLSSGINEANKLQSISMCHLHGVYNTTLRRCVCDCDATLGCWNSTLFCTTCHSGWVGEFCLGDVEAPEITLAGANPLTHEAGDAYVEPGYSAHDNKDLDVTGSVVSDAASSVDILHTGTYTITYSVTDAAGNSDAVTRTVVVVDTTKPVISLTAPLLLTLEAGQSYSEPGVSQTDNADDGISPANNASALDTAEVGLHTIEYTAVDGNGNAADAQYRSVQVIDTTPPVIMLVGADTVTVAHTAEYGDVGASVTDNANGPVLLTNVSTVDTNVTGNYTFTYYAVDAEGNEAVPVARNVHVREILHSCDALAAILNDPTDGIYDIKRDGEVIQTFCHFDNGHGYDLLVNLETSDGTSRHYDDTTFWETTTAFGDLNSAMTAEFKGRAFNETGNLQEILIVYHDNGEVYSSAAYPVLLPHYAPDVTLYSLLVGGTDVTLTAAKTSANVDMELRTDNSGSAVQVDTFMEVQESLILNRQSAFGSNLNKMRLTSTHPPVNPNPVWTYFGIGGTHRHSSWALKYEFSPVSEYYCYVEEAFTSGSSTTSGNLISVSGYNFPLQSGCAHPSGVTYRDLDVAIFALSAPPVFPRHDTCEAYLNRHPSAQSGPVVLGDGVDAYCIFEGGKGFELALNIETGAGGSSVHFDTDFWIELAAVGSAQDGLTETYMNERIGQDLNGARMVEIMVLYHQDGVMTSALSATYDVLGTYESQSLGRLLATLSDTTITSSKTSGNHNLNLKADSSSSAIQKDCFMELSEPLVVNKLSAFGSNTNKMRLTTTHIPSNPNNVWSFFGIGGHHRHNTWGVRYSFHPVTEYYCYTDNAFSDSSATLNNNYIPDGSSNFVLQSSCSPSGGPKYYDYDVAVLTRLVY